MVPFLVAVWLNVYVFVSFIHVHAVLRGLWTHSVEVAGKRYVYTYNILTYPYTRVYMYVYTFNIHVVYKILKYLYWLCVPAWWHLFSSPCLLAIHRAFAVVETIASAYAIETGHLYQLSPQQLISCDYYPTLSLDGCRGGSLKEAFQTTRDVSLVPLWLRLWGSVPSTHINYRACPTCTCIWYRGGTKWSRALTKVLCHHFYPHRLYIVNFDGDFQGQSLGIPKQKRMTVISDWNYNVWARDPSGTPQFFSFNTANVWGHAHDDVHWYVQKSRGILMISYLLCMWYILFMWLKAKFNWVLICNLKSFVIIINVITMSPVHKAMYTMGISKWTEMIRYLLVHNLIFQCTLFAMVKHRNVNTSQNFSFEVLVLHAKQLDSN